MNSVSVFNRLRSIVNTIWYYLLTLVESYRDRGIMGPIHEIRTHLWWRWYRTRMHPQFHIVYRVILRIARIFLPGRVTDADPFKIIYVDPESIEHRECTLPSVWGRVIGGEWVFKSFETDPTYRAVKKRVVDGMSWSEIDYDINDTEVWEALYQSMKKNGYKSQRELVNAGTDSSLSWDCEVGVAIDGTGEIVWVKRGSHRVRMAKLLGIDTIPVQVRIRHPEWQAIRDEIRAAESIKELSERAREQIGHPDLDDVVKTLPDWEGPDQNNHYTQTR